MLKRYLLILCFVLLMPGPAMGESITVVTEEWPPYNYSENGKVVGVITEVVRATLDRSGLEYSIKSYPWARSYDLAMERENVMIFSIFRLPNRDKLFKWIKIDGLSVNMYLFRPQYRDDISVESVADALQYRVGVTRETSTHHFLLSQGFTEGVNLYPVNCEEQNILKSDPHQKRIDLTTGDRLSMIYWLNQSGFPSDYWVEQSFLFKEDIYMAFGHHTSDAVVNKVRAAFQKIKDEGTLEAIEAKYYRMFQ